MHKAQFQKIDIMTGFVVQGHICLTTRQNKSLV